MNEIEITGSDGNVVIQGGSNSTCIINGKKYVNGIEVPYSKKEQLQEQIRSLKKEIDKLSNKLLKLKKKSLCL